MRGVKQAKGRVSLTGVLQLVPGDEVTYFPEGFMYASHLSE